MRSVLLGLAGGAAAAAVPGPEPTAAPLAARAGSISSFAQLNSSLAALSKMPASEFAAGYTAILSAIQPSAAPTNAAAISATMSSLAAAYSGNSLAAGPALLLSGMTDESQFGNPADDIADFGVCNSSNNTNTAVPDRVIYPKASPSDAPYDVPEAELRSAIYFPPGFTYGKKQPVLFLPGTGVEACENFAENLGKIVAGTSYGDPVYVNIPGNMLGDEQVAAEYSAYAVNYVSAITQNQKVSTVSWSAGGPVAQWVNKYWPSTRSVLATHFSVSPDYHGTVLAPLICPPGIPCDASVLQQFYNANWIATLRNNGGDSAYVPTTTVHSIFDEIVEPQQDPFASADIGNAHGAGVTNVQIQDICPPGTFAGGPNFGHESSLYNAVTVALLLDSLKYQGPANVARAGPYNCSQWMASGLTYSDVFATEAIIPLAGFNIFTYTPKMTTEPPIKPYAAADQP